MPVNLQQDEATKAALVTALHGMAASGLSPGASGNASVRVAGGMWISGSGIPAQACSLDNLAFVEEGNCPADSGPKASSEWLMHQQVYRDHPDCHAIVHCHSRFATVLACQRRAIPAFHYMISVAGGSDIPCASYAEFGTPALADSVSRALQTRRACLMANHGQLAMGDTPLAALSLAQDVEELAAMYHFSLQNGGPSLLNEDEMQAVLERFKTYGQRGQA